MSVRACTLVTRALTASWKKLHVCHYVIPPTTCLSSSFPQSLAQIFPLSPSLPFSHPRHSIWTRTTKSEWICHWFVSIIQYELIYIPVCFSCQLHLITRLSGLLSLLCGLTMLLRPNLPSIPSTIFVSRITTAPFQLAMIGCHAFGAFSLWQTEMNERSSYRLYTSASGFRFRHFTNCCFASWVMNAWQIK